MNYRVTLTLLVLACSVSLVQTLIILMGVLIFLLLRLPVSVTREIANLVDNAPSFSSHDFCSLGLPRRLPVPSRSSSDFVVDSQLFVLFIIGCTRQGFPISVARA